MTNDRPEPDADVVGWIIAGTIEHLQPKMEADWDGEVHRSLDAGIASLAECHGSGDDPREALPDYHLYELRRVPASTTGEAS